MDIHECNERYGITLKKLRRMERDGILKIEQQKTPNWWRQVLIDIRKGKMSARSIVLAFRYPEKLEKLSSFTRAERRIIDSSFDTSEVMKQSVKAPYLGGLVFGAAEDNDILLKHFITTLKNLIPDRDVRYAYVAVRLLLTCDTDRQIQDMSEKITRALSNAKDSSLMNGWWHLEPGPYGTKYTVYHTPRKYDL